MMLPRPRTVGVERATGAFAATFAAALFLVSWSCVPKPKGGEAKGELISTSLPIGSYVMARTRGNEGGAAKVFFPTLEIYNESGALLYSSHESIENARILREFPSSIEALHPLQGAPRLRDLLEVVPDFKVREQEILTHGNAVVLSVVLENCHACTVQENAIDDVQQRLLQQSIVLLLIRVSPP